MNDDKRDVFSIIGKLPSYSKLLFKLYKSPGISKKHKLLLSMGIAYSVSPVDLIPGIIPVAGQLDNLLVMLHCLEKVLNAADKEITAPYLKEEDMSIEELREDIQIASSTLKAIGRDTAKVIKNTGRTAGYKLMYGIKKLIGKKPY